MLRFSTAIMRLDQEDPDNCLGEAIVLRDFMMVHQVLITSRFSEKK